MKQMTMISLSRGKEREKTLTTAQLYGLLVGDKYEKDVARLRAAVALSGGRQAGQLEGAPALPDVRVSAEGGAFSGLLVLTLPAAAGGVAALRRAVSQLPQTLLAFRGSSGRTLKVVVSATLPDGGLPAGERDVRLFVQHAVAMAARFYEGQVGVRSLLAGSGGGRRCRMSHDPEAFLNEYAVSFVLPQPVEPLAMSLRRRTAAASLLPTDVLPGYDERQMQMVRFQFCYAAVVEQGYRELDIMLTELARQTLRCGLEAEFCLCRLMHMEQWRTYDVLARRTYRNVYGIAYSRQQPERREESIPYHTMNTELLKQFMQMRYMLRRNLITGGVEYVSRGACCPDWQPLDRQVMNTMTMEALSEGIEAWDKDIQRYVDSTLVADYDPVVDYLTSLPAWDGRDRVARLAARVPTDNACWPQDLALWLRAMVAQWLHRGGDHANALVPLLIGRQGDGKSTFCRRLLPPELQDYYTDRVDFANRNDTERMLSRFCLINIDEYDSLSGRQAAFLKHVLQKVDVKSRRLYESQVVSRQRYATFIGTTNDLTPLTDTTGSRRFLCVKTTGVIDNERPIDYRQLYAQVVSEVRCGLPTYFSPADEVRVQRQNVRFQQFDVLDEVFADLYHLPQPGEESVRLSAAQLLAVMKQHYANIRVDDSSVKRLSRMLLRQGFEHRHTRLHNEFVVARNAPSVKDA